jgi:hypothetical protein
VATIDELNTKLEQLKSQLESQRYFNYRHYGGNSGDYKYTASFDFGQNLKVGETKSGESYQALAGTINGKSKEFRREHYGDVFNAFGKYTATQQSMAQTQSQIDEINRAEKARVAEEERKRKEAEAAAKKAAEEARKAAEKARKEAEQKQFEEDYKKKTQPVTYDELTGGGSKNDTGDNEYTDYFKLTDGTRWSYDRRTGVAIPPGAVGVDRDEWLSLPSRLTSFTDLMNAATGNTDMANTTPIKTDTQLTTALGTLAGMGVPQVTPSFQGVGAGEDIASGTGQVGDIGTADATAASETGLAPVTPGMPDAGVGQVAGVQEVTPGIEGLGGAKAAQLTPTGPYVDMTGVEGTVSPGAMATAAQAELDPRATVQYQLGEIMSSLESGSPMPAWASPQVRKVSSIMQARGLGSSSMAGAAITQALMESGVQIAAADANKYAAIQLQNLSNKQQTALQNAATIAAMDKANLNARLQGAVTEAQALLSVDLKNLDNKQKSDTLTYSSLVQGLFKDAAEENARKQFNAKNELQVEEFFAELGSQVATANANRTAAMRQFNVGEANAMKQFNQQVKDSRDKFNANMSFAVNQSNAVWRRDINTANTALQNESNRINVQNAYNASQTAMNNLWQQYRDNASWNFQKSENEAQRQHDLVTMAMQFANSNEMYDQQQKDDLLKGLGSWLTRWASGS